MAEVVTVPVSAPVVRPFAFDQTRQIGRYRVTGELGRGGMGIVLSGNDPRLDRAVAIKIVTPVDPAHGRQIANERTRQRLLGEARALAQLDHPNVVQVFDVGRHGEHVWLAMELVDGESLRQWAKRAQPWTAKLAILRQVAAGLASAHAVGVVHRDVKPDNVLIGRDGRARMADFGLASGANDEPCDSLGDSGLALRFSPRQSLTRTGAVMGTPAYMAPEQRRGQALDVRADQYALCVMAHELLFGHRPASPQQQSIPCPDADRVPRSVRAAIQRGLQESPEDRFASVEALSQALRVGSRRAGSLAVIGGVIALVIATASLTSRPAAAEQPVATPAVPTLLDGAVESNEQAIEARIEALTADGRYAQALAQATRAQRSATSVGARVAATIAMGRAQLLMNNAGLAAEAFERAYLEADSAALADQATRSAVGMAQALSAEGGRGEQAQRWLRRAQAQLPHTQDPTRLQIRLDEAWGQLHVRAREVDAAHSRFVAALEALPDAESSADALVALSGLAAIHSLRNDHAAAAAAWRRAIDVHHATARADHPRLVMLMTNLGVALMRLQDHGAARGAFETALEVAASSPAALHVIPHALNGLSVALKHTGELQRSARLAVQAAETMAAQVGDHPWVANCHSNAGVAYLQLGQLDAAEREFSRAHVLWQSTLGGDSPRLAFAEFGLGKVAVARGEPGRGATRIRRALALGSDGAGDSIDPVEAHFELAQALAADDQPDAAVDHARRALAATGPGDATAERSPMRDQIAAWLLRHANAPMHRSL